MKKIINNILLIKLIKCIIKSLDVIKMFNHAIESKKTVVIMLDADRCVFNEAVLEATKQSKDGSGGGFFSCDPILKENALLLSRIKSIIKYSNPDVVIFMSASSRQSFSIDQENLFRNDTGSFFPAMATIKEYISANYEQLEVRFNPFLLADVFSNLKTGTSYSRIVANDFCETHANCPLEATKKLWMYCALHELGTQFSPLTNELECHFFDDSDEIITGMGEWMRKNPTLLPSHASVTLTKYDGKLLQDKFLKVKGVGVVDILYPKSAKLMLTQIGIPFTYNWSDEIENKQITLPSNIFTEKQLGDLREFFDSKEGQLEMENDQNVEEEIVEIDFLDYPL